MGKRKLITDLTYNEYLELDKFLSSKDVDYNIYLVIVDTVPKFRVTIGYRTFEQGSYDKMMIVLDTYFSGLKP